MKGKDYFYEWEPGKHFVLPGDLYREFSKRDNTITTLRAVLSVYEKISDQTYKDAALVSDNPLVNDLNALARGFLGDNYGRLRRFLEAHSEPRQ